MDDPPGGEEDEDAQNPQPAQIETVAAPPSSGDGSLGIGGLRRP
jgi:hypothetical protein